MQVGILVTIPLLFLAVLYGLAATTSVSNAIAQTRSQNVQQDLGNPLRAFEAQVAKERSLALLELAGPHGSQVAVQLRAQERATGRALTQLVAAYHTPYVTANTSASLGAAMFVLTSRAAGLGAIRSAVTQRTLSLSTALGDYESIIDPDNDALVAIIEAETNSAVVTESLDSTSLFEADEVAGAEASLLAADIEQSQFPDTDRLTLTSLAGSRQQLIDGALAPGASTFSTIYAQNMPAQVSDAMTTAESTVQNTPWETGVPPSGVVGAETAFGQYAQAAGKVAQAAENGIPQVINQQSHAQLIQIVAAAGIGLLAVIASVAMSVLISRNLLSQLRELRESALTLANDKLPDIMGKLRAGQEVNVAEYAPGDVPTRNEISQVLRALGIVEHAAVRSAVEEARLRRGVSDVFKNLAGRSQSLLHRQLALLDSMERQATAPEQLEDLFRIDHLTTRMRRHAEGLVILSGDTPARGWRQPVPLVDVLRGAVAEVEDYTRIRVVCRARAAVAGHAVADIVHLVAELAENATVFSPPNTPVLVQGDMVGRGFAIEIEDRGLGISEARLLEINTRLANPPQFDLSGSDRLGLFIVGQLARRHDIKVSLRPSIYGGTTAVVLIPTALVVDESALDSSPEFAADKEGRPRVPGIGRHAALTVITAGDGLGADSGNGHPAPASEPVTVTGPLEVSQDDTPPEAAALMTDEIEALGLPVRVPQASLAPQLRDAPADEEPVNSGFSLPLRNATGVGWFTAQPASADADPVGAPASPEEAWAMVSALQRGWQLGRAEAAEAAEATEAASQHDDDADHSNEG